ncbi:MAG: hypothetical protein O3A00_25380 [Planctomycetota bacterium]|nr:hypothetical protein [Planctomycetota bacterium]
MPYSVMELLLNQASEHIIDRDVVRGCLRVLSLFPIGSMAEISDQSLVSVVRSNHEEYTKPVVRRVSGTGRIRIDSGHESELVDLSQSRIAIVRAVPDPKRGEVVPE